MNRYPFIPSTVCLLILGTSLSFAGSLQMTTYYPSPTGNFDKLSATNIGIGTSSPGYKLEINAAGGTVASPVFGITNNASGGTLTIADSDIDTTRASGLFMMWQNNSSIINFLQNKMVFDGTTGSVGIGQATPQAGLDVRSSPQWSSWNFGANVVAGGGRNNGFGLLDSTNSNPWSISNNAGSLYFSQMPALGNVANPPTPRMVLDTNGNVGIGVQTPNAPMQIGSDLSFWGNWADIVFNAYISGGAWKYTNPRASSIIYQDQTLNGLAFLTAPVGVAGTNVPFTASLFLSGTNNNVGIKNNAPAYPLDVSGSIHTTGRIGAYTCAGSLPCLPDSGYPVGWGGGLHTWDVYAEGTVGAGQSGNLLAYMASNGNIYSGGSVRVNGNWAPNQEVSINSNQIWKSVTTGDAALYFQWSTPGGAVVVGGQGGATNDFYTYGSIYSRDGYLYTSDERLKKEIKPISNALDKINQINGVTFTWKQTGKKDIGMIAQNVEKVFPDLVVTDKDGMKSVKYGNLVAVLIEGMKEQQKEIDALKTEINQLKSKK